MTEIPPEVEPGVITDLLCYEVETVGRRGVERRPAVLVLLVDLGPVLSEEPHHHQVVVQHRLQQLHVSQVCYEEVIHNVYVNTPSQGFILASW